MRFTCSVDICSKSSTKCKTFFIMLMDIRIEESKSVETRKHLCSKQGMMACNNNSHKMEGGYKGYYMFIDHSLLSFAV